MEMEESYLRGVAECNAHAGADKGARKSLADAAGGAGDEGDPVVEVGCGHFSSCRSLGSQDGG